CRGRGDARCATRGLCARQRRGVGCRPRPRGGRGPARRGHGSGVGPGHQPGPQGRRTVDHRPGGDHDRRRPGAASGHRSRDAPRLDRGRGPRREDRAGRRRRRLCGRHRWRTRAGLHQPSRLALLGGPLGRGLLRRRLLGRRLLRRRLLGRGLLGRRLAGGRLLGRRRLDTQELVDAVEDGGPRRAPLLTVAHFLELIVVELGQERDDLVRVQVVVVGDREDRLVADLFFLGLFLFFLVLGLEVVLFAALVPRIPVAIAGAPVVGPARGRTRGGAREGLDASQDRGAVLARLLALTDHLQLVFVELGQER